MKQILFKCLATLLSLLMILTLAGCSTPTPGGMNDQGDQYEEGEDNRKNDKDHNQDDISETTKSDNSAEEDGWGLTIGGKSVELPCTLADLEKKGIQIANEARKEEILASSNETFSMIGAKCGKSYYAFYLRIVTGNNPEAKEKKRNCNRYL